MTIQELYHDDRFNNVVYFLNECGFSFLEDLKTFDFDELLFVPGVSEDIIEEVKNLYFDSQNAQKQESSYAESSEECSPAPFAGTIEAIHTSVDFSKNIDLDDLILQCTDFLNSIFQKVSRPDQIAGLRAFIADMESPEGINKSILISLCDSLSELFREKSAGGSESALYSMNEESLLRAVNIETVFDGVKRGRAMIRYCWENGFSTLWDLRDFDFSSEKIIGAGADTAEAYKNAYKLAVKQAINPASVESENGTDPIKRFLEMYAALKGNARNCLLLKAQGMTLQEIGDSIGVTRERVRQIIANAVRKLNSVNGPILERLMQGRSYFYKSDIKTLFSVPEHLDCFVYILENTEAVYYFEFADKFVDPKLIPDDWDMQLHTIEHELVGEVVNYYDILEEVDTELAKRKLNFLDADDFMGFLFEQHYIALGDYVIKRRGAYKRICYDVIRRHFKSGIKLDSDDENQDMLRMREIIFKEYAGYALPDNNRAITARVSPDLILCGRGRYCAPENTVLDEPLFGEIVEYINNANESSLYYSEIFAAFSGRLLAETSVDNANYLHGALKYLYPDDFEYERDLLVKRGMLRVAFGERLANAIKSNGGPITKKELLKQFPGVTDIRIANAIASNPKLIQWDYNEFNHIDNVRCTDSDAEQLHIILGELLSTQGGYSSENNFYTAVKNKYPEFLEKSKIESSLNLFYVAAYLFGNDYRFSRPHIASQAFPDMELTNINVARFFVADRPELYYWELAQISQTAGWTNGTFTIILNAVEEDYIKVDLNRYIHKSLFSIAPDAIDSIRHQLERLVGDSGYYGIFAIFNYDGFPLIDYEWNEHLLQSIIENYDLGFKLLEPTVKDRRYKKGIIVPQGNPCQSFEDFVIAQMKIDGITSIAKDAFSGYLRRKGLVLTATIPIELYDGDGLRLEGNNFVFG